MTSRDTAAAEGEVRAPGYTHRTSMSLKEMSAAKQAAKQAGGTWETEKGKQSAAQKKRTRTTSHEKAMHPALLAGQSLLTLCCSSRSHSP